MNNKQRNKVIEYKISSKCHDDGIEILLQPLEAVAKNYI